jgi:hypothetical protein
MLPIPRLQAIMGWLGKLPFDDIYPPFNCLTLEVYIFMSRRIVL